MPNAVNQLQLYLFPFALLLMLSSGQAQDAPVPADKEISHVLYFTANTGLKNSKSDLIFDQIVKASQQDKKASLVILGNITKKGFPKDEEKREAVKRTLKEELLQPLANFNGNVIFNPGTNEWREGGGQENLDDMESFLQDNSKAEFWPNDGCPIESETLTDEVELMMVDSQWFLEDWDKHPYINHKCEIKTREEFFLEFRDNLKDEQNKTIIIAMHHPVITNTRHGFIDRTGGFSNDSFYSLAMQELRGRAKTTASLYNDVIFVAGSDRNLQFLQDGGIPQIISGAAAKTEPAKIHDEESFASDENGFAKITVFKDRSSVVQFYASKPEGADLLATRTIKRERPRLEDMKYEPRENYNKNFKSSVYKSEETERTGFYKWLWGDHYRDVYSAPLNAPVLFLDDLPGNPRPIAVGGGHQSRSLRLIDEDEHEYTLREMRKSALQFLQHMVKEHYVEEIADSTVAEGIIQDFYTTAHPYAPFAVQELSEDINLYHSNPKIYYVPKQEALGIYNEGYGDKLYMLEEHVGDENKDFETFGSPDDIISTSDLLLELQDTKDSYVDEDSYIKARIFDMLIGDWDRHEDQWRWAQFEQEDGKLMYKPIARDRDQAFPRYDGPITRIIQMGIPEMRSMQTFTGDVIKNTKWFNEAAYHIDKALIQNADWQDWKEQVEYIQQTLTDEKIEAAFASLPEDVQDETIADIKEKLKQRRENLLQITRDYYNYLQEFKVVTGTEEDDEFLITRKKDGITDLQIKSEGEVVFKHSYNAEETEEMWIYGMDGNDIFKIEGKGDHLIKLKIMGGEENDTYNFQNTRKAKLYDYKSRENTILTPSAHKLLVDSYNINVYDPAKRKFSKNILFPTVDFDTNAGLKLGVANTYTKYGLLRNPFTERHKISAFYYFATNGFDVAYSGEFAHIFYNWNLGIDARYTSPNYTLNFFGFGNESYYDDDAVDRDYNRVRIQQWSFAPSLIWRNEKGASFYVQPKLESMEVKADNNEFVNQFFDQEDDLFDNQYYASGELGFNYKNKPSELAYPRRGMEANIATGYKRNIDEHDNAFGYLQPSLSIDYPLHESGIVVLATKIGGEMIFGDNYEFYDAATIGGKRTLRGYRNQRFNGKYSFYQTTDLRTGIARITTNYIPVNLGISLGFDYGRVWSDNSNSDRWHNSYGGSLFVNAFYAITGGLGYYVSDENTSRIIFNLGFQF
ncbi:metallophosphatase [Zunongwangia sp. H14]|uniref:metallophosphatase n=1 Tax=Zunongwangia sp. H14 TaxID=3240792 RepID=UPI00356293FC